MSQEAVRLGKKEGGTQEGLPVRLRGLDGWVHPEKVTLELRLWKRGGSRPGGIEGSESSQCKGPEVCVCTGSSVELEGGCSRE